MRDYKPKQYASRFYEFFSEILYPPLRLPLFFFVTTSFCFLRSCSYFFFPSSSRALLLFACFFPYFLLLFSAFNGVRTVIKDCGLDIGKHTVFLKTRSKVNA